VAPDPKRSAAAKKAAATRKAKAEAAQAEKDRYDRWADRLKSGAIFVGGLALGYHEFFIAPQPREQAVIVVLAALSLPVAAGIGRRGHQ
jgi:hypothetical protein